MKNIQVIDGALNCTYDIFAIDDDDFKVIFPGDGQDIEFTDDFFERVGEEEGIKIYNKLWQNIQDKKEVCGIHGTLFFELEYKKKYYPTKRESEMVVGLE